MVNSQPLLAIGISNCHRAVILNEDKTFVVSHETSQGKYRISIVTCFNNPQVLEANLLKSLSNQNEPFELILVDNVAKQFKSLPQALNQGAKQSSGEFVMFVHQDVYLQGKNWLSAAIRYLESLSTVGVAGISGVSSNGKFVGFLLDRGRYWGQPLKQPFQVQTLDEQLVVVPRQIFNIVRFDERFKFHSYIADYCLTLQEKGYSTYVIPLFVEHNSTVSTLKASNIEIDDTLLYLKHKHFFKIIHKTTGTLSGAFYLRGKFASTFSNLYVMAIKYVFEFLGGDFAGKILDLGCVPIEQPYLKQLLKKREYSVGVSDKKRYALVSKQLRIHDEYVIAKLDKLPFRENSFDITVLFNILEYLPKKQATDIISAAEVVGKKEIVKVPYLCSPIFLPLLQNRDRSCKIFSSCWDIEDFEKGNYRTFVCGVKTITPVLLFAVKQ